MVIKQEDVRSVEVEDARERCAGLVTAVSRDEGRVPVAKDGRTVAALVSTGDLARLQRWERERAKDFEVIDRMRAAFAELPAEEIERETARALAEVRALMRAERTALLKRMRAPFADVPAAEVEREVERALTEVRAEARAERARAAGVVE